MGKQLLLFSTLSRPIDELVVQLTGCGFSVSLTRDLDRAVRLLQEDPPALVVVHGGCQEGTAATTLRETKGYGSTHPARQRRDAQGDTEAEAISCFRALSSAPLLVIDERANAESEAAVLRAAALRVGALRAGADAVLSTPISNRELTARIGALLRRYGTSEGRAATSFVNSRTGAAALELGGLVIDMESRVAAYRSTGDEEGTACDKRLRLPPTAFRVLAALAARAGRTVSYDELVSDVWGTPWNGGKDALRPHVRLLRRELEKAGANPQQVVGQRNAGYRLRVG